MRVRMALLFGAGMISIAPAPAFATGPPPLSPNENSPHNMGYCAPFLGGGGVGVRPDINKLLAENGELFGYDNPGALYSVRARSTDDRSCLPRAAPPAP